jgi:hypothetical protein
MRGRCKGDDDADVQCDKDEEIKKAGLANRTLPAMYHGAFLAENLPPP